MYRIDLLKRSCGRFLGALWTPWVALWSFKMLAAAMGALISSNVFVAATAAAKPSEKEIVAKLRDKAMSNTLAYEILETLTTEVGARMAGTPQDAMAVEWGVNKFKELGFDKVWIEPVTFKTWIRKQEAALLVSPYPHLSLIHI